MAIDKAVDSQQLDGALSASADAIRAKTGDVEPIPFDAATGFASAISAIAAGGGTLAIKTGTVTLSVAYSMPDIQHGCGKLPYAVFMISENKEHYNVNRITGALWHRNSICTLFSGNGTKRIWGFAQQYDVENEAPTQNGLVVTESVLHCAPPAQFNGGTYHWVAIYEV